MKYFIAYFWIALLGLISLQAQVQRCGTEEVFRNYLEKDPAFAKQWEAQKAALKKANESGQNNGSSQKGHKHMLMDETGMQENFTPDTIAEIVIPVVVHVVAPMPAHPANISFAQILDQIEILNEEFSKEITDYNQWYPPFWEKVYAQDTRIRFCLAQWDPEGNSTRGVTRTYSQVSSFAYGTMDIHFDETGGKDAWPRDNYLNIWVGIISGVAGYAQFPLPELPPETDGIVVDYRYFGSIGTATAPLDLGRTAVHEVGHWLGLFHVWGDFADNPACDEDDLVKDTPPQASPSWYDCEPYTYSCGEREMIRNFMNYANDECNTFFTQGQANRMRSFMAPGALRFPITVSKKGCFDP